MGLVRRNRGCARNSGRAAGGEPAARAAVCPSPVAPEFARAAARFFPARHAKRRRSSRRAKPRRIRDKNPAHAHLRKIKAALTPPKPNELDSTAFTRASCGLLHNRKFAGRIGRFKFNFRRQPLFAQRHQANHGFDRARAAEQMSDAGLGGTDRQRGGAAARPFADGQRFRSVVEHGAGAVGVDIINVLRRDAGARAGLLHTVNVVLPCGMRLGEMMLVNGGAVADEFAQECPRRGAAHFQAFPA